MERIVTTDFDVAAVLDALRSDADGATALFFGTVRSRAQGKEVALLRYEVYEAMAERTIRRIEAEVAEAEGAHRVRIQHRTGDLKPGDRTVLVAAASPHRPEAFAACRRALERVKAEVPVWKKEIYADGSAAWLAGHQDHLVVEEG